MSDETNDERIDLSLLDPSRDRERWERRIEAVSSRAAAARRAPRSVPAQLASWAGPALALAAGLALVVWLATPSRKPPPPHPAPSGAASDPAFALERWSVGERPASVWEELEMMGVGHEHP